MSPASPAHLAALSLALLLSCHATAPERELDVELPASWSAEDEGGDAGAPRLTDAWWEEFDDAELQAAIVEALAHNRDLSASAARLSAAVALARVAGADRLPSLSAGGSATRTKQIFVGLGEAFGGPGSAPPQSTSTTYGVSLDVSWEADLWGKLRARAAAGEADLLASAADHVALRQSLAAQTAKAWFAWREALAQASLAERAAQSFERSEALVRRRYESGAGNALDLRRAEAQTATARAGRAGRRATVERAVRQVQLLLGRPPQAGLERSTPEAAALPDAGPRPPAGLPSELLQRRPDLRAAEARLLAADERLVEARAALYPSLQLTGSVGRTSDELGDLLDGDFGIWSLMGGLLQPLYAGGRLAAGVDLAEARVHEAAAAYAGAVLRALAEVDTLLAVEGQLVEREDELTRAMDRSRKASELAADRYAAGLADLTTLLDTQRAALEAEGQWLTLRRERLDARIDLQLALGGGFGDDQEPTDER